MMGFGADNLVLGAFVCLPCVTKKTCVTAGVGSMSIGAAEGVKGKTGGAVEGAESVSELPVTVKHCYNYEVSI